MSSTMSNLIIPSDSIVISKQCLGGGASGTVYKAIYANEIVAVKTLITSSKDFQKEATTLSSLNHPRIVRCLGILLPTSIVLEYLHLGSLHAFYTTREKIPYGARVSLGYDVASGVEYLHACGVLHRDLKSLNVLLCVEGGVVHAKIGDFGLAVVKKTDLTITSGDAGKGTLVWMAPELHDLRAVYGPACDIYSLGIILSELFSWLGPFGIPIEEIRPEVLLHHLTVKREIPETILDDDCPPALSRLVEKCVNMDAESRPRITEVVKAFEVLMENVTVPSAKQMGIVTSIIDSDFMSGQSRGDSRLLLPQTTTFDVSATAFHSNPRNHSSGSTYVAIHSRREPQPPSIQTSRPTVSPSTLYKSRNTSNYARPTTAVITTEDFEPTSPLQPINTSYQHTYQNLYDPYSQATYTPSRPTPTYQTPYHTSQIHFDGTLPTYSPPNYTSSQTTPPTQRPTESPAAPPNLAKSKRRDICIALSVITCIVSVGVFYYFLSKDSTGAKPTAVTPTASVPLLVSAVVANMGNDIDETVLSESLSPTPIPSPSKRLENVILI